MGEAFSIVAKASKDEGLRLRKMCSEFCEGLLSRVPGTLLNGHETNRIANNLSFSIDGIEPLALIRRLRAEISFSASSACASDKIQTSHVLEAMFGDTHRARAAFRIAPGRFTTPDEMARALEMIIAAVTYLRGTLNTLPNRQTITRSI